MNQSSRKHGALEPIAALNRVKIRESGEPLVDIRAFCPDVVTPHGVCPYLRRTVAEMLNRAQAALPTGHRFRIGTALRTLSMQKRGWDGYFQRMREEHPNWPLSALRRATNRYFAPYDQPAPPGHCTGAAVDVVLLGPDGEPLDVTSPTKGWEAAYTWSDKLSREAKQNRMTLVETMLGAGFSNCREEYWHYSWGDSAWAVRVGERECPYGFVKAPLAVEADYEGGRARDLRRAGDRTWVFSGIEREEGPHLHIGLFWAEGEELRLQIEPPAPGQLYVSADRESWQPVAAEWDGSAHVLTIRPEAPRVYVTSHPEQTKKPGAA